MRDYEVVYIFRSVMANEDIEARAFSREELTKMLAAGEIIDLKTIAGLALTKP